MSALIINIFASIRKMACHPAFLICLLCICSPALQAQQAVVTLDRSQILLGEQVTLQLKVENITDEAQQITQWFNVPDTANHIEVIHRDKIDTIRIEGQTTLIQKITITSFDSGKWVIPATTPAIKDINGQSYSLSADSVTLEVMPVDVSHLQDFHPVKDILPVDYTDYTWLYIISGILILALLVFLIIKLIKNRRKQAGLPSKVIKGPPLDWALKQIDLLEKEKLVSRGKVKEFFTRLNDICRTYFDERTQSHTLQSTSVEMMAKLQSYLIKEKDRTALKDFTELSNVVKFAEHHPDETRAAEAVSIAKETLRNIEKQVVELNKNNDH